MKYSYKNLSFAELLEMKKQLQTEHFELKCKKILGHVDNPLLLRELRRRIARINTRLYEHPEISEA